MLKIGIAGTESSHTRQIVDLVNRRSLVSDAAVVAVLPEVPGEVDGILAGVEVVGSYAELAARSDAVAVTHRDAREHIEPAKFFLNAGMRVFVDKPFTHRRKDAQALFELAERRGGAVTSAGAMPYQASTVAALEEARSAGDPMQLSVYGHCDISSPYAGVFFYGIHQIEILQEMFGSALEVGEAAMSRRGGAAATDRDDAVVTLHGDRGVEIDMHLVKAMAPFALTALYGDRIRAWTLSYDKDVMAPVVTRMVEFFRTGVAWRPPELVTQSVELLEQVEQRIDRVRR